MAVMRATRWTSTAVLLLVLLALLGQVVEARRHHRHLRHRHRRHRYGEQGADLGLAAQGNDQETDDLNLPDVPLIQQDQSQELTNLQISPDSNTDTDGQDATVETLDQAEAEEIDDYVDPEEQKQETQETDNFSLDPSVLDDPVLEDDGNVNTQLIENQVGASVQFDFQSEIKTGRLQAFAFSLPETDGKSTTVESRPIQKYHLYAVRPTNVVTKGTTYIAKALVSIGDNGKPKLEMGGYPGEWFVTTRLTVPVDGDDPRPLTQCFVVTVFADKDYRKLASDASLKLSVAEEKLLCAPDGEAAVEWMSRFQATVWPISSKFDPTFQPDADLRRIKATDYAAEADVRAGIVQLIDSSYAYSSKSILSRYRARLGNERELWHRDKLAHQWPTQLEDFDNMVRRTNRELSRATSERVSEDLELLDWSQPESGDPEPPVMHYPKQPLKDIQTTTPQSDSNFLPKLARPKLDPPPVNGRSPRVLKTVLADEKQEYGQKYGKEKHVTFAENLEKVLYFETNPKADKVKLPTVRSPASTDPTTQFRGNPFVYNPYASTPNLNQQQLQQASQQFQYQDNRYFEAMNSARQRYPKFGVFLETLAKAKTRQDKPLLQDVKYQFEVVGSAISHRGILNLYRLPDSVMDAKLMSDWKGMSSEDRAKRLRCFLHDFNSQGVDPKDGSNNWKNHPIFKSGYHWNNRPYTLEKMLDKFCAAQPRIEDETKPFGAVECRGLSAFKQNQATLNDQTKTYAPWGPDLTFGEMVLDSGKVPAWGPSCTKAMTDSPDSWLPAYLMQETSSDEMWQLVSNPVADLDTAVQQAACLLETICMDFYCADPLDFSIHVTFAPSPDTDMQLVAAHTLWLNDMLLLSRSSYNELSGAWWYDKNKRPKDSGGPSFVSDEAILHVMNTQIPKGYLAVEMSEPLGSWGIFKNTLVALRHGVYRNQRLAINFRVGLDFFTALQPHLADIDNSDLADELKAFMSPARTALTSSKVTTSPADLYRRIRTTFELIDALISPLTQTPDASSSQIPVRVRVDYAPRSGQKYNLKGQFQLSSSGTRTYTLDHLRNLYMNPAPLRHCSTCFINEPFAEVSSCAYGSLYVDSITKRFFSTNRVQKAMGSPAVARRASMTTFFDYYEVMRALGLSVSSLLNDDNGALTALKNRLSVGVTTTAPDVVAMGKDRTKRAVLSSYWIKTFAADARRCGEESYKAMISGKVISERECFGDNGVALSKATGNPVAPDPLWSFRKAYLDNFFAQV